MFVLFLSGRYCFGFVLGMRKLRFRGWCCGDGIKVIRRVRGRIGTGVRSRDFLSSLGIWLCFGVFIVNTVIYFERRLFRLFFVRFVIVV